MEKTRFTDKLKRKKFYWNDSVKIKSFQLKSDDTNVRQVKSLKYEQVKNWYRKNDHEIKLPQTTEYSTKNGAMVHDDLKRALEMMVPHFAVLCGKWIPYFEFYFEDEWKIKDYLTIDFTVDGFRTEIQHGFFVTGINIDEDRQRFSLIGGFYTQGKKIEFETPEFLIHCFSEEFEYAYWDEFEDDLFILLSEIHSYIDRKKFYGSEQLTLFDGSWDAKQLAS